MCDRKWVLTVCLAVHGRLMSKLRENLRCHLSPVHDFTVAACYASNEISFLTSLGSIGPPRSNAKGSFPYVIVASPHLFSQIFPTNSAFSSFFYLHIFLGFPVLPCPWRFQFKTCSSMAEESFFNVCLTHFHFRSLIGIATSCWCCCVCVCVCVCVCPQFVILR
jgi:hypothetical protein